MTTIDTETPKLLRADARRNRERILESARELFAQGGVDVQIDDVARHAGVGVGTVYRHFPTKEALMIELVRQKFRRFAEAAQAGLEREGEPFEVLADVLRTNAGICSQDAVMQHALSGVGEAFWESSGAELQELGKVTEELVARAQRAGTMRPEIQASDIPMIMCGVSSTMAHKMPGFDWHRHLELVIEMMRARSARAD